VSPSPPESRSRSPQQPLLSGVVVHWGDPAPLAELAAAWPDDPRFELVVVDNGPFADRDHAAWEAVRRRGRVVSAGRNLGFAGGANAGAREARGDRLLILNPDARPEAGALEALLEGFRRHPGAAGLAPRLVGEGGEPQFPWQLRGLPSAWQLLAHAIGVPAASEAVAEPAAGDAVEQPAAAALALSRETYEAAGGFDPAFHPAWFEDVDLAARLAAAGRPLLYWPAATFRHTLGGTVGQLGYGRFLWAYQRNLVRYLGKHHGSATAALARLLLPAGLLLRLALLPVRTPKRAASRAAAARGLAGALAGAFTGWRRPQAWASDRAADRASDGATDGAADRAAGPPHGGDALAPSDPPPRRPADAAEPSVAVCMVTRDSRHDLAGCFASIAALDHRPLRVVLVDCASGDGTVAEAEARRAVLADAGVALRVLALPDNRGFAGGMNAALAAAPDADWILSLNADARPEPEYVGRLLDRAAAHPELAVAAVTGRLLRPAAAEGEDGEGETARRIDACGMRLTRTWRHLDRGSGEPDRGQLRRAERVFGATGAASLFRRTALEDAALEDTALEEAALEDAAADGTAPPEAGQRPVFDPLFHSFREDAELAFRLRERGWEILYEPTARAEHRRFNLPSRRAAMPAAVNRHSLKNRYLLRAYHQTPGNLVKTLLPTLCRDLLALGYVVLREPSSLPAYAWLWRHRRVIAARRRAIQARRRRPAAELDRWFGASGRPL